MLIRLPQHRSASCHRLPRAPLRSYGPGPFSFATLLLLLSLLPLAPSAVAQEASVTGTAASPAAASGVEEDEVEIYYLQDKDGNLVPVPDVTFEEFERWLKADLPGKTPPPFNLEVIRITGNARDDYAELNLVVRFVLTSGGQDWTAIPLGLPQGKLREPAVWEGEGDHFVNYDSESAQYVAWARGPDRSTHQVTLKMLSPLVESAGEKHLQLTLPPAVGFSELELRVPRQPIDARMATGGGEPETIAVETAGESSLIRATGIRGEVAVSWSAGAAPANRTPAVLEAHSSIRVTVLGPQHLHSEARLKVRSFGGPVESFQVRLPEGMRLAEPLPQHGFRVTPVAAPDSAAGAGGQWLDVQLAEPSSEPAELQLLAEMIPQPTAVVEPDAVPAEVQDGAAAPDESELIEASGFEVRGAVRQWGHVDVAVEGDWSVQWFAGAHVRRIETPPETANPAPTVARFEYYRQPFSLQLQISPREQRISVEPRYEIYVAEDQIQLEGTFKYQVNGNRAPTLDIDLKGWVVDQVFPESLIDTESSRLDQVDPLSIQLARGGQTTPAEFEIRLQAHRTVGPDATSVNFKLPRPRDSLLAPATVFVRSARNVELTPRSEEMAGLIPEPISVPRPEEMVLDENVLIYRERSVAQPAEFAADFNVRERSLVMELLDVIRIEEDEAVVEQRFSYRTAFGTVDRVLLDMPRSLLNEDVTFALGPERIPLPWFPVILADEGGIWEERAQIEVDLPESRLGPFELFVQYSLPMPQLTPEEATQLQLLLVLPPSTEEMEVVNHEVQVTAPANVHVEPAAETWTTPVAALPDSAELRSSWRWSVDAATPSIKLLITSGHEAPQEALAVEQAWVQTWLIPGRYKHRAALRVDGSADPLRVVLPPGASLLQLMVDGRGIRQVRRTNNGALEVEGISPLQREHLIELWYTTDAPARWLSRVAMALPRVIGAGAPQRLYWQLVAPQDEHLVWSARTATPEWDWQWQGYCWVRRPTQDAADLSEWVGSSGEGIAVPDASNQYLLTAFGDGRDLQVVMARRTVLVSAASLAILGCGLLLIYFPVLRHPALLMVAGVAIAAGAIVSPSTSLLAAQGAAAGIALLLVALLFERVMRRRRDPQPIIRGSSYVGSESKTTDFPVTRPDTGSHVTSTAAHLPLPLTASEPKSL